MEGKPHRSSLRSHRIDAFGLDFFRIVCFDSGLDDAQTQDNDEGQVKAIIEHPLMKTVYAIAYDANKRSFPFDRERQEGTDCVCS